MLGIAEEEEKRRAHGRGIETFFYIIAIVLLPLTERTLNTEQKN